MADGLETAVLECKRQANEDDDSPCPDCSDAAPVLARRLSRIRVCAAKGRTGPCGCIRIISSNWSKCFWCGHARNTHKRSPEETK